ncbi:MAG: hypothetical protein R3D25_08110 [Geminicoccaceae bacterium]
MLRDGDLKLIYHVGMPSQLFELEADPDELSDLGPDHPEVARLEALLRRICDPEAVDARAKADQRAKVEFWGGQGGRGAGRPPRLHPAARWEAEIVA